MSKTDDLVKAGLFITQADAIIKTSSNVGTPGSSVIATEYGDEREHLTVLTVRPVTQAVAGAALGFGKLIYTFPAGSQIIQASYMSVGVTAPTTGTDVTKIDLGPTIASGAVLVLNGTAAFMSIMTEQTGASAGVAVVKTALATSSPFSYITDVGGTKTVHLNVASTWTDTGNVTYSGTVALRWTTMA